MYGVFRRSGAPPIVQMILILQFGAFQIFRVVVDAISMYCMLSQVEEISGPTKYHGRRALKERTEGVGLALLVTSFIKMKKYNSPQYQGKNHRCISS